MLKYSLSGLALCLFSTASFANWNLNNELSRVNFVSVKKNEIGESHYFKKLNASINDAGQFNLDIDLTSVETLIPIRNERMQKFLFNTKVFPKLNLTSDLSKQLKSLKKGQSAILKTQADLALNGINKLISLEVLATQQSNGDIVVASFMPVIINPADYNLTTGIDKLQELAKLPSITHSVPVSFVLKLNKAN
ncbi:YceI family protein [Pseudoalteromonas sp. C2R02]|uniref:YceI family protein n=1 Tax=Pseudoalteromonas sp. C2R02 TaxID=2841565 RepID=UPI001C089222|nr:YceI family protein [Pseudoalteromonas sp. C2R02]MBU2968019.1 YceI family protein [Pseudoalteromonas sp. C2R02]